MASRTQIRLQQITGSFGNAIGKIRDDISEIAATSIVATDLTGALGHIASAIKRINGGATFSAMAPGEFNTDLVIKGATPTVTIGDGGEENTALIFDGAEQNFYVGLKDDDNKLHIGLGSTIGSTANLTLNSGDRNVTFQGDIEVLGGKIELTNGGKIDSETSNVITITEDKVVLTGDLEVQGGDIDVNSAKALNIGATVGANDITLGASTSTVLVPGNLIVQGPTTSLTSSNTVIQDAIIGLATSGSEGYGPSAADRGIVFGGGDLHAKQPAVYFDGSVSRFVMATQTVSPTSASFPATPAQGDLGTLVVSEVQFAFDENDKIVSDGTDLEISTAGNLNIISTVNEAASIFIRENAGTAGQVLIKADQGAGASGATQDGSSIQLLSDVGGIGLLAGLNNENAISIEANGGTNETIRIHSNQGTGVNAKADGAPSALSASIHLVSDVGGIGLYSGINGDNAITLEANGGANETIQIRSNQGTGVATADIANAVNASIALVSDVGGIAALSGLNGDGAIFIGADAGANETVRIHSHQGTGVGGTGDEGVNASISLVSDAGGVAIASGLDNAASVYMKGFGFTFDGGDQNDSFLFNNSPIQFEQISAPSSTANKLYNVGGDLFWNGSSVVSTTLKGVYVLTASHAVGVNFATDGNAQKTGASDGVDGLGTTDAQGATLDVYVNGQLLVSGSETEVGAGDRDYMIENATNIAFAFALESDDVVQVIKR